MDHPARPRDKVRQALLEEAERLAGVGSWVWNIRTDEQEWSENLYRLLGFEPGSVAPSSELFLEVVHPDDRARVQAAMARSADTEAAPQAPVPYRVNAPSGEVRTLEARVLAVRDEDGELLRFVGTVTDVTEAIAREKERERNREVMEISHQMAKLGSWSWDPSTNEAITSPEIRRIIGTDQAMDRDGFLALVHPHDLPALLALPAEAVSAGEAGPISVRITRPDGELRHLEIKARATGDDPATATHVGILHDVTDRVRLEQELQLSRTLEATGRLAAGVAHDFNNLLMVVMNSALELAEERPDERLEQIVAATESGADVVRRLLAFGRQVPREPKVIDLSDAVRDVAGWVGRLISDDVSVSLELEDAPALVRADEAQLHQVLLNLAVNARDAMPDGGTVTLRTTAEGDRVRLSVRDEGAGMSPEVQKQAFEPFFSTKAVGEGTGLGLSMAYGVITRLGGTVRIESMESQGTTVVIELPRASREATETAASASAMHAPTGAYTILLVEDDESVRRVALRLLKRKGHTVLTAADPDDAQRAWTARRPDLVLSDLSMPSGGGERVAALLAVDHPGVPIVFMTGHAPDASALPGATLLKPFRPEQLHRVVAEAMRQRGSLV